MRPDYPVSDADLARRVDETLAMLTAAALAMPATITGDGRVSEDVAAALLGYERDTLRKRRIEGTGPVPSRLGMNGCRVSYKLRDLAEWSEAQRGFD